MSDTFHKFVELPTELRHLIWEAAFDRLPGVQILEVCISHPSNRNARRNDPYTLQLALPKAKDKQHHLGTPRSRWWLNGNPSKCLADHRLWMACRESRRVIQQLNKSEEIHFFTHDKQLLAMRPYRDLSLIQDNVFAWADCVEPGTLKPHQVAFEYDSSWSTSKREYGDRFWLRIIGSTAIRFALHVEASEGLSIVDYSLVRRSAGTCGLDGRAQESLVSFYAGGYKLVQVDMQCNDSMELELVGWEYIKPEDGESVALTSIDILNKMGHLIERQFDLARRGSVLQQVKLLALEEC